MAWYGNHLNIYFNVFVSICCYRGIRNTSSSVEISIVTTHEMQPGNRRTDRQTDGQRSTSNGSHFTLWVQSHKKYNFWCNHDKVQLLVLVS